MESTVLFPGVRGQISEDLVAEAHRLLQHLNRDSKRNTNKATRGELMSPPAPQKSTSATMQNG